LIRIAGSGRIGSLSWIGRHDFHDIRDGLNGFLLYLVCRTHVVDLIDAEPFLLHGNHFLTAADALHFHAPVRKGKYRCGEDRNT
jgi:hypothetical protein